MVRGCSKADLLFGKFRDSEKMAKGQSNSGRHTCFMCILFLMSAGAITMSAIVLQRMLEDDDKGTSASTVSPNAVGQNLGTSTPAGSVPDFRSGAVVDCDPPNQGDPTRVTKEQCESKQ